MLYRKHSEDPDGPHLVIPGVEDEETYRSTTVKIVRRIIPDGDSDPVCDPLFGLQHCVVINPISNKLYCQSAAKTAYEGLSFASCLSSRYGLLYILSGCGKGN